jgi:hypothetical protein
MAKEIFGSLIKEEQVASVEQGIFPNTLVLENLGQFPGYYGACCPVDELPDSVFLVLNRMETTEKILKVSYKIKKQLDFPIEGTWASIQTAHDFFYTIRLKGIARFEQISQIQSLYQNYGFEFMKAKKINEMVIIKVQKLFIIDYLSSKVLKSSEKNTFYVIIDHSLDWVSFKEVTRRVRNNINISAFDAALAFFYSSDMINAIRIYTDRLTIDEFELLGLKYNEIIEKMHKEGTINQLDLPYF